MRLIDADSLMQTIEKITEKVAFEQARGGSQFRSVVCMACRKLLISLLKDAPTVDPVKHGHWVQSHEYNDDIGWKCSVCRATFIIESGDPIGDEFFYCPKCGTKMDEEEK